MQERQLVELRELLESGRINKELVLQFINKLNEGSTRQHIEKRPAYPVTKYTTVKKHYTCNHCGHTWDSTIKLGKNDSVPLIRKNGSVEIVGYQGATEVEYNAYVNRCERCVVMIAQWDRKTLEERYFDLLGMVRPVNTKGC
jgi:transcription elongation factor Elf1